MQVPPASRLLLLGLTAAAVACSRSFRVERFNSTDALYSAAVAQLERRKWENAAAAFEKLTVDLPARDPRMPLSLYFLGKAREGNREYLLAAQSYERLAQTFPDDTLADDALLAAGQAYARMWRKPSLDMQYGETAAATLQQLLAIYPDSPLRPAAEAELRRLDEWFATKLYDAGMLYFRRKGYDSSIIYFKDVVRLYPKTQKARDAQLRLVQAYRAIRYREDVAETCAALRQSYPGDREVARLCGEAPRTAASPVP
jgi:outer membrane assembly lipoprotein YfiO